MQQATAASAHSNGSVNPLSRALHTHGLQYPSHLEARYPHVIQRLISLWNTPDKARFYLQNLADSSKGGAGFPPAAFQEIRDLYVLYEKLHTLPSSRKQFYSPLAR